MAGVLELAASMSTAPLDPARPLWDATLVTDCPRELSRSCSAPTMP